MNKNQLHHHHSLLQHICTSKEKIYYKGSLNGMIHVAARGGSASLSPFSTLQPNWSVFRDLDYGFVKLTAFDHSNLLFEYKKSRDGKASDSFNEFRPIKFCGIDGFFFGDGEEVEFCSTVCVYKWIYGLLLQLLELDA